MKKLIAVICAVVMVMALAVPAMASDSPSTEIIGAYKVVPKDFKDPTIYDLISRLATPSEIAAALPLSPASPMGVPENIDEYVQVSPWAWIPAAGAYTVTIPQLKGVEDLSDYLIQMITPDGQLAYIDLAQFADSFDAETGTITVNFPVAGAFCVIAPASVAVNA